jgi:hypothetical protein
MEMEIIYKEKYVKNLIVLEVKSIKGLKNILWQR